MFHAVQGHELFLIFCTLYANLLSADVFIVKGVHGLSEFQHHIVCDIYEVIDRANAGSPETNLHPRGRRRKTHIFNKTRSITTAKLAVL